MKIKNSRMEALKMLISSMELGSQEEVLRALEKEGFKLTQATLSRDPSPSPSRLWKCCSRAALSR